MDGLSFPAGLPSLSQTSPCNNITGTGTVSPAADIFPRTRKDCRADAQTRQRRLAAVQAAKREVSANVKEDWVWPPSGHQLGNKFPRRRKSTQWEERESDATTGPSRSPSPGETDGYKSGSPDVAAPELDHGRTKRRKLMMDELKWNEGLRVFFERRNFWTGANFQPDTSNPTKKPSSTTVSAIEPNARTNSISPVSSAHRPPGNIPSTATLSTHDSIPSSPLSISTQSFLTSTSQSSSAPTSIRTSQSSEPIAPSSSLSSTKPPLPQTPPATRQPSTTRTRTVIPLGPSLLSPDDHPILTSITHDLYPTIYSKCIVQSLAPSYPINLSHVVRSLVQGWKKDGEWPPKSSVEEDGKTGGRKGSLRGKMKALRVEFEGNGEGAPGVGLETVARKGVGKVKRVLRG